MYEQYMQDLLGVRLAPHQNTYENFETNMGCCTQMNNFNQNNYMSDEFLQVRPIMENRYEDLEKCYPDIYRIVYPMVRKICMQNTRPVNEELIDEMTKEIYNNIETGDIVNININVENSTFQNNREQQNRNENIAKENSSSEKRNIERINVENRQFNTPLNDLIRILIIRELIGRPGGGINNPPPRPRPPMNRPPRPPMPRF